MDNITFAPKKISHKIYALLNLGVLATVIWWNYYSNTGNIGGKTVGELSAAYANYFTPAGYAFSIWGLIYLGLVAQAIYILRAAFSPKIDGSFISDMGPYLIIANIFNAGWLWFWLTENTGLSVVTMLGILFCLIILILNLNMERWDAPARTIAFIWWPIAIYSGWIAVATIANVSAYLAKNDWTGPFSEMTWVFIMISIATAVNLFMIFARNLREFALVGIWALIAIAVRHWESNPDIKMAALVAAGILFLAVNYHGFKNRKSNPFMPDFLKK
ncbi:hypothetical protein [Algoriphagus namhaensis]